MMPKLSVIIPIGKRHAEIVELYDGYRAGLDALGRTYECIFVLDGPNPAMAAALQRLLARDDNVIVIGLTKRFGESTALMAGFQRASGEIILTLPAYHQIEAIEIGKLVAALEASDIAIARRWPRAGSRFEAVRRDAFHGLIASITDLRFHDLGCGARAMKRRVLEEIALYGDQHRFLPVLADRQGFRVTEVNVRQSRRDRFEGSYEPRDYVRRTLDIFTVFFLVRFTKKPLRFFGMVGVGTFGVGALLIAWLVFDRIVFDHPLADRPALLLSSLLVVLGLQLFAIGLLGELIIFTHARDIKDYQIDEVIRFEEEGQPSAMRPAPSARRQEAEALHASSPRGGAP
jgi:glycosyltransferase involved in cell wall biosynthesis